MNKKQYQSPAIKVVKVKTQQMLCGSETEGGRTEQLNVSSFNWDEEDEQ